MRGKSKNTKVGKQMKTPLVSEVEMYREGDDFINAGFDDSPSHDTMFFTVKITQHIRCTKVSVC